MKKDDLYNSPREKIAAFEFDEQVAKVFPDMIARSVPGYQDIIDGIGLAAKLWVQPGTRIYDLGCSLGAASLKILSVLTPGDFQLIGVDNSLAMLERFKQHLNPQQKKQIQIICADINHVPVSGASLVILNFTLQFVKRHLREALINTIYQGLLPGGILILSEKICHMEKPIEQDLLNQLHHAYKKSHGYSELEISQKRTALENVLVPESWEDHHQRLKNCGFQNIVLWYRHMNFISIIAKK